MTPFVSLNSDLGEGYGAWAIADDAALMGLVSDVNIACGFHAGDPSIMRRTVERAVEGGLGIGAHVGFADLRGFGRRHIEMAAADLADDLLYQLGALTAFVRMAGGRLSYVKPHGALYHSALARSAYAEAILTALTRADPELRLLCQPGTTLAQAATNAGIEVLGEAFIDRSYTDDGLLVPRGQPGAVISDPLQAGDRAVAIATQGTVESIDGNPVEVSARSLCIHSDSPGALEQAQAVRAALNAAGVQVRSLVG